MTTSINDIKKDFISVLYNKESQIGNTWMERTFKDLTIMQDGSSGAFYAAMHPNEAIPDSDGENTRVDTGNLIGSIRKKSNERDVRNLNDNMEFEVGISYTDEMRPKGKQYSRRKGFNRTVPHKDSGPYGSDMINWDVAETNLHRSLR